MRLNGNLWYMGEKKTGQATELLNETCATNPNTFKGR